VQEANGRLSRVEQIKRFAVLPVSWEPGGDELTPTMKLKRQAITAKYANIIESLYAAEGQSARISSRSALMNPLPPHATFQEEGGPP
jgi:long-chain acyl-CoA synthetase